MPGVNPYGPGAASAARDPTASRTGLPSRDDLVSGGIGDIPPVTLSLHVYDASPTRRFAIINGGRSTEGESIAAGLKLEEITPEGVVMSWRASRFLVTLQ
jgi:general secretion pathway protein B